jgi:hypothetical protein
MKTVRVPHDAEKEIHPEGEHRESGISMDYRNLTIEHYLDCRFSAEGHSFNASSSVHRFGFLNYIEFFFNKISDIKSQNLSF